MNVDGLEDRNAEGNRLLGAAYAGCADTDRPHIRHFVEVARRASGMGCRTFAAHLVEAVALAVCVVAELVHEAAGVEVRATRAVIVNQAVVGELADA